MLIMFVFSGILVAFFGDAEKVSAVEYMRPYCGLGFWGCGFMLFVEFVDVCCLGVILPGFFWISWFCPEYGQLILTFLLGFF